MKAQWQNSRRVTERIFIQGQLILETPANFGNGDTDGLSDIPLLLDAYDNKTPLLTGTSIAGALRNYLRELETGYGIKESQKGTLMSERLFGYVRKTKKSEDSILSWLMVDDARGEFPLSSQPVELRDGVVIDPESGTAEDKKKFDVELLAAGTTFNLSFEFWLNENNQTHLEALALALKGFEDGAIGLGMRKNRGYGQCRVTGWKVQRYHLDSINEILNWLSHEEPKGDDFQPHIMSLLGVKSDRTHQGEKFVFHAYFKLKGSLLIRSLTGEPAGPDSIHLHSLRKNDNDKYASKPVLSGTSLAGVIRSRAMKIAQTLKNKEVAESLIDGMFGNPVKSDGEEPFASRVIIQEKEIVNGIDNFVQSRIKIDRFTGGAYPNALFSEQPVYAKTKSENHIELHLELRKTPDARYFNAEVGLLLLVLKDLWTGDLPVGGQRSVGRGRLEGIKAALSFGNENWNLVQKNNGLEFSGNGNHEDLQERFVKAFWEM